MGKFTWMFLAVIGVAGSLFLFRGEKKEAFLSKWESLSDFEQLMGKESSRWQYVQTREDKETLAFFKQLYEKNFPKLKEAADTAKIPTTLHLIWLGPKEFPQGSVANIAAWMKRHPTWTVKFWTDINREAPHPNMERVLVQESHLPNLLSCYYLSDNFGERSELLRYEILAQEGGVYIDHDLSCHENFDHLNRAYDFYCGLEELAPSIFSSSVFPSTHLIAAKAHHPVLLTAMEWVKKRWQQLETDYPGNDPSSLTNRVKHRSFAALGEAVQQKIDREKNIDIVLPAAFFSQNQVSPHSFATHAHAGSWWRLENILEKKLMRECEEISARFKTTEILLYALVVLSLSLLVGVFFYYKQPRVHARS